MKVEIVETSDIGLITIPFISRTDWELIKQCYARSEERWVGLVDDNIACMWGLIPPSLMSDQAYLWLYHTPLVEQHKFRFIRHSQIQMQRMLKLYPHIVGDCKISNHVGKRWLEWLGAKFGHAYGNFTPFEIKAKAYG